MSRAADRIVEKYPRQIEAITQFVIDRPSEDDVWDAGLDAVSKEDAAFEEIAKEFADDAFCSVAISRKGHHGERIVKKRTPNDPGVWSHWTLISAQGINPEHRVYFGSSERGELFYVYEGWVPESKHMRRFEIWIDRNALK